MLFTHVVPSRHVAVRYLDGVYDRVLPAGRHLRRQRETLVRIDLRERLLQVAPQEVTTSDAVTIRVSATLRLAVVDPPRYLEATQDAEGTVYLQAQLALREAVAGLDISQLTGRRVDLGNLTQRVNSQSCGVGVEVREVALRDLLLPVEIRTAALELMSTRHRATIQLEQARADAAALRSLANSAKLLDEHPALAQLRLVQAVPMGSRILIGVDSLNGSDA